MTVDNRAADDLRADDDEPVYVEQALTTAVYGAVGAAYDSHRATAAARSAALGEPQPRPWRTLPPPMRYIIAHAAIDLALQAAAPTGARRLIANGRTGRTAHIAARQSLRDVNRGILVPLCNKRSTMAEWWVDVSADEGLTECRRCLAAETATVLRRSVGRETPDELSAQAESAAQLADPAPFIEEQGTGEDTPA